MNLRIPRIGSRLSRFQASRRQGRFRPGAWSVGSVTATPLMVWTFAGRANVPEVVLMWRSLIRAVGLPLRFLVVSDGSIPEGECAILPQICPGVEVLDWGDLVTSKSRTWVGEYAESHPLGKKLAVLMSIPVDGPTIFTDSDVIFFGQAVELMEQLGSAPRFLLDCAPSLDRRMLDPGEDAEPVNSGVLLMTRPVDWTAAMARFERVRDDPERFSEQTVVHLAMRANGGRLLDAGRCLVTIDDQFWWRDMADPTRSILRHYVGPVRHKMWNMAHRVGLLG